MTLSSMYGPARTLIDNDYLRIGPALITPFDPKLVQPASYDVTLHDRVLVPRKESSHPGWVQPFPPPLIDLRKSKPSELMEEKPLLREGLVLYPGNCALVCTHETVTCPNDMICSVDGKSTVGRCFLAVHVTAGFIDPGFVGRVTLELVNHGPWGFVLYPGMKVGQLRFTWLAREVDRPYGSPDLGSHYQGSLNVCAAQTDVTEQASPEVSDAAS